MSGVQARRHYLLYHVGLHEDDDDRDLGVRIGNRIMLGFPQGSRKTNLIVFLYMVVYILRGFCGLEW